MNYEPQDPNYEARVRGSFARQTFMTTLGASIRSVKPGEVVIDLPFQPHLLQQHGFLHAGAVTAIVDSACGYAALTLMPPEAAVLSVEYKVNFVAPAKGTAFRAIGRVIRSGKTITVCSGEVRHAAGQNDAVIAVMQATMIATRVAGLAD